MFSRREMWLAWLRQEGLPEPSAWSSAICPVFDRVEQAETVAEALGLQGAREWWYASPERPWERELGWPLPSPIPPPQG